MLQLHTTSGLRTGAPFALTLGAAFFAGCSSDDSDAGPDLTAPTASAFVQNRTLDPTGQTVSVTFSEIVSSATAEVIGNYTFSGGVNVTAADQRTDGTTVDLTLDAPAIPGTNTISIAAGIEDANGNTSAIVTAQALTSTDTTAPAASSIAGTTISGAENDTIAVVFNDDMVASEVMSLANWTLESPLGSTFDATGATAAYDAMSRTATITALGSGATDQNLQTFDQIHASFTTMRDIGGNTISATAIGAGAVNSVVGGDMTPPTLLAAAPWGMDVVLTFDEDVAGVETADLQSMSLPTGTEIILTDISNPASPAAGTMGLTGTPVDGDSVTISDGTTAVPFEFDYGAQGSISLSGLPTDTDMVTISDGTTAVTFEFDDGLGGGVTGANTAVLIGVDADATTTNLIAAVNLDAFDVTASPGVSASDTALRNDATGTGGNSTITIVQTGAVITAVDMAGGGVTGGATAVAVDAASDANTITNLRAAVDGDAFDVTTGAGGAATDFVLTNDNAGTAGNVLITEVDGGGVISFTGMAGGTEAVIEAPSASTASGTPLQGTATFSFAPVAGDTLRIYGVTDLAGNQMLPMLSETVAAANATIPALSATNSIVTANSGENNDTLLVKFDAQIHPDGATNPANYSLDDGAAVDLTGASFEFDQVDEVTITFDSSSSVNIQSADTYDLTVNNVRNVQGAQRTSADSDTGIIPAGDATAPSGVAVSATLDAATANAVIITFDEAVSETGAVNVANYTLASNATTDAALIHPRAVRVTFTSQPVVTDSITIGAAALTDLAGNAPGSSAMVATTAADATAPTVTAITAMTGTASGSDEIQVTFDEPVNATQATTAANYAVTSGSAVSLTGATIWMSSVGNVVNIRLADGVRLDTGEAISVTTSNVTDLSANAIVAAASMNTVAGDATAPSSASAFLNYKQDATGATIDVEFPESMDSTTTMTIGNWTGSGSQAATAVTQLNSSLYRVVFDAPIGASDMVSIATPTDRANNAGSTTIMVNPAE